VVTEHGVASLQGKSLRQRSKELISIAHPDFRKELTQAAQKLFWPK
jgi:acyl-CoA hydrolase